jgi:hypothetical protein
MGKTGWIIGAVVVVAAVIGGTWFFVLRPSPAPPSIAEPELPPEPSTRVYASTTLGYSLTYPTGFTLNERYAYEQFGPDKLIHGLSLTIPAAMATGTNLSPDTYLSVEQLPRARSCTGDIYLLANVAPSEEGEGAIAYSVASSTSAAAGNRYEEVVYALKDSSPCTAVRYFVHYSALENYEPGAVRAFDRAALLREFDTIRRSLTQL